MSGPGPDKLYAWSRLLAIAAEEFGRLADKAAPGSLDYLEWLDLSRRCNDAADRVNDEADPEPRAFSDDAEIDRAVNSALQGTR